MQWRFVFSELLNLFRRTFCFISQIPKYLFIVFFIIRLRTQKRLMPEGEVGFFNRIWLIFVFVMLKYWCALLFPTSAPWTFDPERLLNCLQTLRTRVYSCNLNVLLYFLTSIQYYSIYTCMWFKILKNVIIQMNFICVEFDNDIYYRL